MTLKYLLGRCRRLGETLLGGPRPGDRGLRDSETRPLPGRGQRLLRRRAGELPGRLATRRRRPLPWPHRRSPRPVVGPMPLVGWRPTRTCYWHRLPHRPALLRAGADQSPASRSCVAKALATAAPRPLRPGGLHRACPSTDPARPGRAVRLGILGPAVQRERLPWLGDSPASPAAARGDPLRRLRRRLPRPAAASADRLQPAASGASATGGPSRPPAAAPCSSRSEATPRRPPSSATGKNVSATARTTWRAIAGALPNARGRAARRTLAAARPRPRRASASRPCGGRHGPAGGGMAG